MKYVKPMRWFWVFQPWSKMPWTTGMKADRPRREYMMKRMGRNLGVRKRGWRVKIAQLRAVIVV